MADDQPRRASRIGAHSESTSSPTEERDLLIAAVTKAAAEYGYDALTVELVLRRSDLNEDTFYAHFDDIRAALLAAQERFIERLWAHAMEDCDVERDWPSRVKAALDAALRFLTEAPVHARVFTVEVAGSGPVATERQQALIRRLASRLREGRARYPLGASLPESTEQSLIGGITSLISGHLLAEEADLLLTLEPEFLELLLTPYLGSAEARRLAQA